jgi:hypothetical protein
MNENNLIVEGTSKIVIHLPQAILGTYIDKIKSKISKYLFYHFN